MPTLHYFLGGGLTAGVPQIHSVLFLPSLHVALELSAINWNLNNEHMFNNGFLFPVAVTY